MRTRKSLKAIAFASAGLVSAISGATLHGAGTSYTWIGPTTGTLTWANAANWSQSGGGSGIPSVASDSVNFTVTGLTVNTTYTAPSETFGTLVGGDPSSAFRLQTSNASASVVTLDNGGAGVSLTSNSAANGQFYLGSASGSINAKENVTFNTGVAGFRIFNFKFDPTGTGTTVTINGTETADGKNKLIVDGNSSVAKTWIINSGATLAPSGATNSGNTVVGDIVLNAGSAMRNLEPGNLGHNDLLTINGNAVWDMNNFDQSIGALTGGAAGTNGWFITIDSATVVKHALTLYGGTDSPTTPDFAGTTFFSSLTLNGGTQKFSGAIASVTGLVTVNGGTLELNKSGVAAVDATGLVVIGPGNVLLDQSGQIDPAAPVTLTGGGIIKLATGSGIQSISGVVSIDATSQIDVNTEKLVLSGATTPSVGVIAKIKTGYAAGAWTGPGIMTSAGTIHKGLGYKVDGSDNTTIKFTLYGDTNLDGSVNFSDLVTLAQNYNSITATWSTGDSNYDNTVNFADLVALAQNYNGFQAGPTSGLSPSFLADWNLAQSEVAAVPEPASVGLLGIGAVGLIARRRNRLRI